MVRCKLKRVPDQWRVHWQCEFQQENPKRASCWVLRSWLFAVTKKRTLLVFHLWDEGCYIVSESEHLPNRMPEDMPWRGSLEVNILTQCYQEYCQSCCVEPKDKTVSRCRYEHYKSSGSVQQALERGASIKDLEFDFARGYMSLLGVEETMSKFSTVALFALLWCTVTFSVVL